MQFFEALRYPFRGPHRWVNLGCILVCMLIPVLGAIVISGYVIIAEKTLILSPFADPPRFDFGKFSRYLQRGVPPFAVSLIASCALAALWVPISLSVVLAVLFLQEHHAGMMIAIIVLAACAALLLMVVSFAVLAPLMFKAGMDGKILEAFDKTFLLEYWRRVGWAQMGAQLWMMAMYIPVAMISFCLPLVGPYLAISYLLQVQAHMMAQLYLLYVRRGGPPLPFEPEPPDPGGFPIEPMPPPQTVTMNAPPPSQ